MAKAAGAISAGDALTRNSMVVRVRTSLVLCRTQDGMPAMAAQCMPKLGAA